MNIEEKIFSVLSADAGVIGAVPIDRIRPPGNWEALDRPYIVHFPVTPQVFRTHETGSSTLLKIWRYQVSCFAGTYSAAKALAVLVRAALDNYRTGGINSYWVGETHVPYELDVLVQHIAVEFEIADSL